MEVWGKCQHLLQSSAFSLGRAIFDHPSFGDGLGARPLALVPCSTISDVLNEFSEGSWLL